VRHVEDAIWIWYAATVAAVALLLCDEAPGGSPLAFAAIHGGVAIAALGVRAATARRSPWAARTARGAFAVIALPIVFSSVGLILPAVHPEPFEWTWLELDRALLGGDPTVAVQGLLTPWTTEILQWVYASFYLIPIAVVGTALVRRDAEGFDRALPTVVFCFLLSYLGYLLWPTLPPYRFLEHQPLEGVWLAERIHALLDMAEFNRWDCFPSGHTMLTVISLLLAWRRARALFWVLLPIVMLLVSSTVALRYHYVSDVVAGLLGVPLGLTLSARLLGPTVAAGQRLF
jgi:membrane-associated phospholipid phosphatase